MSISFATIHQGTPTIKVQDNRGLAIRTLQFYRTTSEDPPELRLTQQKFTATGHLLSQQDPRLPIPNFSYQTSLTGNIIHTESQDSGNLLTLNDIEGRPFYQQDARHTQRNWLYESTERPFMGRLLAIDEQVANQASRILERLIYAPVTRQNQAYNLCGQVIRHYDTAGCQQIFSVALNGYLQIQQRQLLADFSYPSDWQGTEQEWQQKLSTDTFITRQDYDIGGALLQQIDADGNIQQQRYNCAGQLISRSLQVKDQPQQIVLQAADYVANGQIRQEILGNGVITDYSYEAETGYSLMAKTYRPVHHPLGYLTFQDLRYTYDPVGNIILIQNDAHASRFYHNQKSIPENHYRYDTFYQLIEATGRESLTNRHPFTQRFLSSPADAAYQSTPYTRQYQYDASGNLTMIKHLGASQWTKRIYVSATSNHALSDSFFPSTSDLPIEDYFDAAGNQLQLQIGQNLTWNGQNQLASVTPITRETAENDSEIYCYDSQGVRLVKQEQYLAGNVTHIKTSCYLPGIEIITHDLQTAEGQPPQRQSLRTVIMLENVRVLHWANAQDAPPEIGNNALRYSINNQIDSCILELNEAGQLSSEEEFFPYGGTAWWAAQNQLEAYYKTYRYSGKERDASGLYYYGSRYYQPWIGRWLNPDPAGTIDGLNLYRMVRNNPVNLYDPNGNSPLKKLFGKNNKPTKSIAAATAPLAIQRPEQKEYLPQIVMDSMYQQIDRQTNIKYLSEQERMYYEVEVDNEGLLRNKISQSLFNQTNEYGESGDHSVWNATVYAYVISLDKKLYLNKHVPQSFHHSSFMAGANVLDAGMISVLNGQILSLTTKSGHYKPTIKQKLASIDYLKENNADLSQAKVIDVDGPGYLYEKTIYRAESMYLKGLKATETNIARDTLIAENVTPSQKREIYRQKLSEFTRYQIKKPQASANVSTRL